MARKKMDAEERSEYRNGKYMGGPAEEKAEKMKKKVKRAADGGMMSTQVTPPTNMLPPGSGGMPMVNTALTAASGDRTGAGLRSQIGSLMQRANSIREANDGVSTPESRALNAQGRELRGQFKDERDAARDARKEGKEKSKEAERAASMAARAAAGKMQPPGIMKKLPPAPVAPPAAMSRQVVNPSATGATVDAGRPAALPASAPVSKVASAIPLATGAAGAFGMKKGGMVRGAGCAQRGWKGGRTV